jgi:hypothetical protein
MSWIARLSRFLVVGALVFSWASPPALAGPPGPKLAGTLGDLWSDVLARPAAENPFTGGDRCVVFDATRGQRTLTPFAPAGDVDPLACQIKPGVPILVTGWTSECSNQEPPPYFGSDEETLERCVLDADAGLRVPEITVDGQRVVPTEVTTDLLGVVLPAGNIFEKPAGTHLLSVAHGWVTLLPPPPPGCHDITIHVEGHSPTANDPIDQTTTTRVIVGSDTDCAAADG